MLVVGVDGFRGGWVAVVIDDGVFAGADVFATSAALAAANPDALAIGIDIPIGLPGRDVRTADRMARRFVGARRSSVFTTPPRRVLEAGTYAEARRIADDTWVQGVSAQAYRLRDRILEVAVSSAADDRFREVHPEASFRAMAGAPLSFPKKQWNGQAERRRLLEAAGIVLPDRLPGAAGEVPPDDLLDAAAAGWSAARIGRGIAGSLPDPPERIAGRQVAIWF